MPERVLAIFAHPDDESFGPGGTLAKFSAAGAEISLVTATRGEGSTLSLADAGDPDALGATREKELNCAVSVLGIQSADQLGYPDTLLNEVPTEELGARFADEIRRVRPDLVLTFGPGGITGNPDHIAVTDAVKYALRDFQSQPLNLWQWVLPEDVAVELRRMSGAPFAGAAPEEITTVMDVSEHMDRQRAAIDCHRSQSVPMPEVLRERLRLQRGSEFFIVGRPA